MHRRRPDEVTHERRLKRPAAVNNEHLAVTIGGADAGRLSAQPALTIAPESADVIDIPLTPSAAARLQVADALAGGHGVAYTLKGTVSATPDAGKVRDFDISGDSALSPAPGLPGVLR